MEVTLDPLAGLVAGPHDAGPGRGQLGSKRASLLRLQRAMPGLSGVAAWTEIGPAALQTGDAVR